MTDDDMFRAAEVSVWGAKVKVLEAKKKKIMDGDKIVKAGKALLVLWKPVDSLLAPELSALLEWYTGIPNTVQGLKAGKLTLWVDILKDSSHIPMMQGCGQMTWSLSSKV